jgi:uncharacterized protein YjeT (DUF2065 family)
VVQAIQLLAVLHFVVVGGSHILAPRAWAEWFILLREKGQAGVLLIGMMSLAFGSLIVAFHPVWTGLPLVLTVFGVLQVLKGLLYLWWPQFGLDRLAAISMERAHIFRAPGAFMLGLAALITWAWFR